MGNGAQVCLPLPLNHSLSLDLPHCPCVVFTVARRSPCRSCGRGTTRTCLMSRRYAAVSIPFANLSLPLTVSIPFGNLSLSLQVYQAMTANSMDFAQTVCELGVVGTVDTQCLARVAECATFYISLFVSPSAFFCLHFSV